MQGGETQMYLYTSRRVDAAVGMTVTSGKNIVNNIFVMHGKNAFWVKNPCTN